METRLVARLVARSKRALHKNGKTLRSVLQTRVRRRTGSGTRYRKAKTHKYTRSSAKSLLAALKASVNKCIRKRPKGDKTKIENVEVTVNDGHYLVRIFTSTHGCPLSYYFELLESEGMEVLHAATFTDQDRIFHTLIVESDMERAHDTTELQNRLCKTASNFSMKSMQRKTAT